MISSEHLVGQESDFVWIKGVADSDLEAALGGSIVEGTTDHGRFVTTRETIDRLADTKNPVEVYRVVWRGDGREYDTTVLAKVEPRYAEIMTTLFSFREHLPKAAALLSKLADDLQNLLAAWNNYCPPPKK